MTACGRSLSLPCAREAGHSGVCQTAAELEARALGEAVRALEAEVEKMRPVIDAARAACEVRHGLLPGEGDLMRAIVMLDVALRVMEGTWPAPDDT